MGSTSGLGKGCLYTIIIIIILYAILCLLFVGGDKFYTPAVIVGVIALLTLSLLKRYHVLKPRNMKIAWIAFSSLFILSCGVYEAIKAYDRSIFRVSEGDLDLELYAPFTEKTKAVSLDEISSLKLNEDLPILDGATALYPLYSAFARAVYPKKEYDLFRSEVRCHNTINAYDNLIHQNVDVIFVASPSKQQLKKAKQKGVVFNNTPVGREAFVFFVNTNNPVDNLTIEQLRGIYSGRIKNWKELGGKDESIRPFQRNEDSGSQSAFLHFMKGDVIMNPPKEDIVGGMGGIISQTADYTNYSNAIGFSFRFYANEMVNNNGIKLLKIEGIYPDIESIKDNSYPLASQFYAVTLSDNTKPNVLKLLEWITSEQGQWLVEKTGYCALHN